MELGEVNFSLSLIHLRSPPLKKEMIKFRTWISHDQPNNFDSARPLVLTPFESSRRVGTNSDNNGVGIDKRVLTTRYITECPSSC